ncbi:hypothetical protein [Paraburkholderia graminis]
MTTFYISEPKNETITELKEAAVIEWIKDGGIHCGIVPTFLKYDTLSVPGDRNSERIRVQPHYFMFFDEAQQVALELAFPRLYKHSTQTVGAK